MELRMIIIDNCMKDDMTRGNRSNESLNETDENIQRYNPIPNPAFRHYT
jgi:hypothetical protein